jgi:hypothetical protein
MAADQPVEQVFELRWVLSEHWVASRPNLEYVRQTIHERPRRPTRGQ